MRFPFGIRDCFQFVDDIAADECRCDLSNGLCFCGRRVARRFDFTELLDDKLSELGNLATRRRYDECILVVDGNHAAFGRQVIHRLAIEVSHQKIEKFERFWRVR